MNNSKDITNQNEDLLNILEQNKDLLSIQNYKKGTVLNIKGDIIAHLWYIKNGLIKGWDYIPDLQRNAILNFFWKGTFLSFDVHQKKPIPVNIEVVEEAVIYKISEDNFNRLKQEYPELEDIEKRNFQNMLALSQLKTILMHYNNATVRYKAMAEQYSFFGDLTIENQAEFMGVDKKTIQVIIKGKKPPPKR